MKNFLISAAAILAAVSCSSKADEQKGVKDAFDGKFYIGTALNEAEIRGLDTAGVEVVKKHFNSIVAENCMKSMEIHPQEDVWTFELADKFIVNTISFLPLPKTNALNSVSPAKSLLKTLGT